MRFILLIGFVVLFLMNVEAQQHRFIYIQTENKQPFSVRLNEKVFSATAAGYVVIPKLTDGTYSLSIGFPNKEWPTQQVEVTINGRDEGFLLKNFVEKGWALFNLQSLSMLMASTVSATTPVTKVKKKDAFSNALAEVTDSPVEMEAVQPAAIKPDSPVAVQPVQNPASVLPASTIKKQFSYLDSTGRSLVYIHSDGVRQDTIRVFIPYPKQTVDAAASVKDISISAKEEIPLIKPDSLKDSSNKIVLNSPRPVTTTQPVVKVSDSSQATKVNVDKPALSNPVCKASATEDDFLKLRKKMAAVPNEEDMIAIAKKAFRSKCYSSMQLKNLGLLFLKDDGRYNFFDVAYKKVSDPANFPALEAQLSDPYYVSRFRAMLR